MYILSYRILSQIPKNKTNMDNTVKTFTEIDDEIKRIRSQIKTLRTNKVSLESDISTHMNTNQIEEIDCTDDTKVKKYTKKSISNVFKKENVESCSILLFGEERTKALIQMIEDKKEVRETVGIKRMKRQRVSKP